MLSYIFITLVFAVVAWIVLKTKEKDVDKWKYTYNELRNSIKDEPLPLMLVDEEVFLNNLDKFLAHSNANGKKLRLATKSNPIYT